VYKDQDKAVEFINQLSKVYRYLLDNHSNELVTLQTELEFIHSYTYLLSIRFDKNIKFSIEVPSDKLSLMVPPMSLQMLVENAIKHNEISEEQPLSVFIGIHGNKIKVMNNFQLRSNREESSKTGLRNIKERYKYFSNEEVEVIQSPRSFIVQIPLIR
jgi:LytS/YehU family sensor histidine kinase